MDVVNEDLTLPLGGSCAAPATGRVAAPVQGMEAPRLRPKPAALPCAQAWLDSYLAACGVADGEERRRTAVAILDRDPTSPATLVAEMQRVLAESGRDAPAPAPGTPKEVPGTMPVQSIDTPWDREAALPWPLRTLGHFCAGLVALLLAIARNDV